MGPMPGPMPFRRYVSWFLLCGGAVVSFLTCNTLFFISIKSHESKLRELKQRLLKTEGLLERTSASTSLLLSQINVLEGNHMSGRYPRLGERLVHAIYGSSPGPCANGACNHDGDHELTYAKAPALSLTSLRGVKARQHNFTTATFARLCALSVRPLSGGGSVRLNVGASVSSLATPPNPVSLHRARLYEGREGADGHKRIDCTEIDGTRRLYGLIALTSVNETLFDIEYSVRNFLAFTTPCWGLIVVHSPSTAAAVTTVLSKVGIGPEKGRRGAYVVALDQDVNYTRFNDLFKSTDFWLTLPASHVLMFQTDSFLLKYGGVDEFVEDGWDYVGAPWTGARGGAVGNGGLSLRRVAAMVAVSAALPDNSGLNEDLYFSHLLLYSKYWVAPVDIGKAFSVEQVPGHDPAGVHQLSDAVLASTPWAAYRYEARPDDGPAHGPAPGGAARGLRRGSLKAKPGKDGKGGESGPARAQGYKRVFDSGASFDRFIETYFSRLGEIEQQRK